MVSRIGIVIAAVLLAVGASYCGADLYVSPRGSDADPGTKERPFASLQRARDAVRALKQNGGLPPGGVTVWLHGGAHVVKTALELGPEDSGTAQGPVSYRAYPKEAVTLFGGAILDATWFAPVGDQAVLDRIISPGARGKVLQVDLRARGITDYGELSRHGFAGADAGKTPPMELSVNGERMTLARWPNADENMDQYLARPQRGRLGVVSRAGIVDTGPKAGDPDFMQRGGTITYAFDRPRLWAQADDIWLDGVFTYSWEWSYNKIAKMDVERKQITLAYGEVSSLADQYSGDFFHAENLLEEMDQPGEYYLDRKSGILYLLPPASWTAGKPTIAVSTLATPMFVLRGASYVTLADLTLDTGRSSAVACEGGEGALVERCEIRNFAGDGASLTGKKHGIRACHVHRIGGTAILLGGGNLQTLEPSGCFAEGNHIHHFGYYNQVYTSGVALAWSSVGSRVAHNLIHDCPHLAMNVYGNDHVIEYNEFHDVVKTHADMGAIYLNLGGTPLERGTVIRRNYFHHIGQDGRHLQNGVYPDNCTMGVAIDENVFYKIGATTGDSANCRAIDNNSGAYILARNNVFVDCTIPYMMNLHQATAAYDRMKAGWEEYFRTRDVTKLPHATKYPELLRFWDEPRQFATSNVYERNLIWNPTVPLVGKYAGTTMRDGAVDPKAMLQMKDNWVADRDPGFVDAARSNFALRADAVVFQKIPGFERIPFEQIGLLGPVGPESG